jgi:hypothetical protein
VIEVVLIAVALASKPMVRAAESLKGEPVSITCQTEAGSDYAGMAFIDGNQMFLGQYTCEDARKGRGAGMLVFLHELGHNVGFADEREATCFALRNLRPVLRRFYHFNLKHAAAEYRAALVFMHNQWVPDYWCAA